MDVTDRHPGLPRRVAAARSPSLFVRVFAVNALLLIGATIALALSPATVSFPVTSGQLVVLGVGLVVILAANAFLLRVSFAPLRELARTMNRVDLLSPGTRLEPGGASELASLIETFNHMVDRLELERASSSRRSAGGLEEERRRLASELHDEVGQGLTAVLLRLKNLGETAPEHRSQLAEAQDLVRARLDEVRRIVRRLRPTVLDDLGLGYALLALADAFEDTGELRVSRDVDVTAPRASEPVELALYRIAQEALTNTARHARAGSVDLRFASQPDGSLELVVSDDGRGMHHPVAAEGAGMRAMRERALGIGARLTVTSRPGSGTTVRVTVDGGGP